MDYVKFKCCGVSDVVIFLNISWISHENCLICYVYVTVWCFEITDAREITPTNIENKLFSKRY